MSIGIRDQAASVKDTLQAVGIVVYDVDEVPNKPPKRYAVIYPCRRFGGDFRFSGGESSARGFRVPVMYVGETADGARWVEERVETALEGVRVQVDGVTCTQTRFESSQPVGEDPPNSKVYSGRSVWIYAARPTS